MADVYLDSLNQPKPVVQPVNDPYLNNLNATTQPVVNAPVTGGSFLTDLANIGQTFGAKAIASSEQALGGAMQFLSGGGEPAQSFYSPEDQAPMDAFLKSVNEKGLDFGTEARMVKATAEADKPVTTYPGKILSGAIDSIGQMIPTVAVGLVGGVVPALASMSAMTGGITYDESIAKGMSVEDAGANAAIQGISEGLTEAMPFVAAAKFFKPGAMAKKLAMYFLSDIPGEAIATAVQNTTGKYFEESDVNKRKEKAIDYFFSQEHAQDQLDTFWTTVVQGAILGGGASAVHRIGGASTVQTDPTLATQDIKATVEQLKAEQAISEVPVDEDTLVASIKSSLTEETPNAESTGSTVASGTEVAAPVGKIETPTEAQIATPVEGTQNLEAAAPARVATPNPELVESFRTHFTSEVNGDNIVLTSPEFLKEGNFAEDILISTGTKAKVAIITTNELQDNPELHTLVGGSVGDLATHMRLPKSIASILKVGNRYVVAVDHNKVKESGQKLEVVTHEAVGHVVAYEHYDKATPEQKAAIEEDYNKYVASVAGGTAVTSDMYPFRLAKMPEAVESISLPYVSELQSGTNVGKEWLANQITKWATTTEAPLSLADKWFKKLAMAFRVALKRMQIKGDTSALAVTSVSDWLNSIFDPSRLDSIENTNSIFSEKPQHTAEKKKSIKEQMAMLRKAARPEDLARFSVGKAVMSAEDEAAAKVLRDRIKQDTKKGMLSINSEEAKIELAKIEGKYKNAVSVTVTMDNGTKVALKTIRSSSRTTAQREAELFKLINAAAVHNIINPVNPDSARTAYYVKLFKEFKGVIKNMAKSEGTTAHQAYLNFISNPTSYLTSVEAKEIFLKLDAREKSIFRRIESAVKHNPAQVKKAILFGKRVLPTEVIELETTEKEVKQELSETTPVAVSEAKKVVRRKKGEASVAKPKEIDSIQNTNAILEEPAQLSFQERVKQHVENVITSLLINGVKVNQERVTGSVIERLRLDGQDARDAKKFIKDNWSALSTGQVVEVTDNRSNKNQIPDAVSDEEASAFLSSIDDLIIYHGTNANIKKPTKEGGRLGGTYYFTSKIPAKAYGDTVLELSLSDQANIVDATGNYDDENNPTYHYPSQELWEKLIKVARRLKVDLGGGNYDVRINDPLAWEAMTDAGPGGFGGDSNFSKVMKAIGIDAIKINESTTGVAGDAVNPVDLSSVSKDGNIEAYVVFNQDKVQPVSSIDDLIVYHGTSKVVEGDLTVAKADPNGLYGPGIYMTEDAVDEDTGHLIVTEGYAGTFPDEDDIRIALKHGMEPPDTTVRPNIHKLYIDPKPVETFDIDRSYTIDEANKIIRGFPYKFKLRERGEVGPSKDRMIMLLSNSNWTITGNDLYDYIGAWLVAKMGAISSKYEKEMANEYLVEHGYNFITHEGGVITGGVSHKVWIALKDGLVHSYYDKKSSGEISDLARSAKSKAQIKAEKLAATMFIAKNKAFASVEDMSKFVYGKSYGSLESSEQEIIDKMFKSNSRALRKKKVLSEQEEIEKLAAKFIRKAAREEKLQKTLDELIAMSKIAVERDLSLQEYMEEKGFTPDQQYKALGIYLRHFGSIFSQREQIERLSRALGLTDAEIGDTGLNDFIQSVFPQSLGTIESIGRRGANVLIHRLQALHDKTFGLPLDFTKELKLAQVMRAKEEAYKSAGHWTKVRGSINSYIDRVQDKLSTTPAGARLVELLKQVQGAQFGLYSRDYMRQIDAVHKNFPNVSDRERLLEKYTNDIAGDSIQEIEALALMNQLFSSYGQEMEALNFKIRYNDRSEQLFKFNPNEKYFPHMWKPGTFDNPSQEMINSLIRSGQALNEMQARKLINNFKYKQQRFNIPRFANMEMAREVDFEGWIKDPVEVMRKYVASGSKRLAIIRILGNRPEARLMSLATEHFNQGIDPDALSFATDVIQAVTSWSPNPNANKEMQWGAEGLQGMAVITMLQHTQLLQPGVAANVAGRIGWLPLLRSMKQVFTKEKIEGKKALAYGYSFGVAERFLSREMMDSLGAEQEGEDVGKSKVDKFLRYTGMIGMDQTMRSITALAGAVYIPEQIAKAAEGSKRAERELRRLYIDSTAAIRAFNDGNEKELEDWIRMGSFHLTNQTNFATDALTMPNALRNASPVLQLLTLFSRFAYHQHKHWADMIKDNKGRLFTQALSTFGLGVPIYILRLLAKGIDPEEQLKTDSMFKTLYKIFMSGSGVGIFAESVINAVVGSTSSTGGPVGGTLQGAVGAAGATGRALVDGKDLKEGTYVKVIRGFIDAGIYTSVRYGGAPGAVIGTGAAMVAPAIEKNFLATKKESKVNFTGEHL